MFPSICMYSHVPTIFSFAFVFVSLIIVYLCFSICIFVHVFVFLCVQMYSYVPTIFSAIHQFPLQHWKLQHKFLFDMCKSLVYIFTYICINMQISCMFEGRNTHKGDEEISALTCRNKTNVTQF